MTMTFYVVPGCFVFGLQLDSRAVARDPTGRGRRVEDAEHPADITCSSTVHQDVGPCRTDCWLGQTGATFNPKNPSIAQLGQDLNTCLLFIFLASFNS
jgi:hypothetical protein